MEKLMFSAKLNSIFANLKDVKQLAKKLNHKRHPGADPRELNRMRAELNTAREHARLMDVINRNRIF
jgi:hypothetical protein